MKKYLIFLIICIPWLLLSDFYPYKLEFNMQPPFMNNATFNVFQPSFFEDYDQNTPESQPLLFTISIQNISAEFIDYEILFVMRWRDLYSDAILRPTAEQPQPGGRIILNNRDLVSDGNTTIYEIEDNFDNMLNEMDEIVLGNGRMPDGSYFFSVQVFEPGSLGQEDKALSNIETLTINVNSPTPISLITPGNSIEMGPAVIEDSNPSFVWVSNLSEYNLKIYEIDDVDWVESEIIATQPFFLQENINSTSLLYPASGPELEMGNTYAWQVEAKLSTPFGRSESIKSDLYVFTLEGNSNLSPQAQRLNNFLKQLDLTGAQDALQLLQEGFEPKSVTIDGEETNLNELLEILQKNQNGKIEIKSITIE